MSVYKTDLEGYVDEIVRITVNFIREINSHREFNRYMREEAEKFQENITEETEIFVKDLKVTGRVPIGSSANIHEMVADYLLRGKEAEESEKPSGDLISVKEMLTQIEKGFVKEIETSIDTTDYRASEKTAKIYFPLIKKSLEKNIRKHRPNIFQIMNPAQKTLEKTS